MSRQPKAYLALAAVAALMAIVPATSSAAWFGYEGGGSISSKALTQQVLKVNAGLVKCNTASGSGTLTTWAPTPELYLTVQYGSCNAFGFVGVKVSPAEYRYEANGKLDLLNEVKIDVQGAGCRVTLPPQNDMITVTYTNNYNKVKMDHALSGIAYTAENTTASGSASLCGTGGTNGTFTGTTEMEKVGGGKLWWNP